jgi:hypothetical protein
MKGRIITALLLVLAPTGAFCQTASQSSVQNTANPTAVVNQQTGGGVNLNQQYNNQWDNHNGFAPGVYCRTPTFYLGSGYGLANSSAGENDAQTSLTQISAGVLLPFGSSVLDDCKRMATALTDRAVVANEVALVRFCSELKKDKIVVDPIKFPAIAKCAD